jgi:hypothetical protein
MVAISSRQIELTAILLPCLLGNKNLHDSFNNNKEK